MSRKPNKNKIQIIAAAEQLFAQKGIDAVSMREINIAANQSNTAAVHYHFGNKSGVLDAVIKPRMSALDEIRRQSWVDLKAKKLDLTVEDCVEIIVQPMADKALNDEHWRYYFQILAFMLSAEGAAYAPIWANKYDVTVRNIFNEIRAMMPTTSANLWTQLTTDIFILITHSLSDHIKRSNNDPSQEGLSGRLDKEAFQRYLLNTVCAMLRSLESMQE